MKIKSLLRSNLKDEYQILRLQNYILNVMQYIDKLCVANRIEYYIIGGTALGAVRHGGFIPWDDDLDIAMTRDNYNKFIKLCNSDKFDKSMYYFQQERKDWIGYFSKVRLLGTYFEEIASKDSVPIEKQGIFVDIFPLDNVPNNRIYQYWWYFCGKILVAYKQSTQKEYVAHGFSRKISMRLAYLLHFVKIRHFFEKQVERFNKAETSYIGGHSLVSRFKNTFTKRELWGKPTRVPFETITLMAPEDIKWFLSFYFGDYMKLPPVEARVGHHLMNIEYGNFEEEK